MDTTLLQKDIFIISRKRMVNCFAIFIFFKNNISLWDSNMNLRNSFRWVVQLQFSFHHIVVVISHGQSNSSTNKIENDFLYKNLENLFSNNYSKQKMSDEFRLLPLAKIFKENFIFSGLCNNVIFQFAVVRNWMMMILKNRGKLSFFLSFRH